MKEKLLAWMNSRRYNSHLMRLLVGGYIVYLGGKILANLAADGAFPVALTLCAVLLILLGLPVALISFYACLNGYSSEYKGKPNFRKDRQEAPADSTGEESPKE